MATDAISFSSPIEMSGWEARHFVFHNASTAPTAWAREGQVYWDTVEKQLKIDTANGANWANLLRQGRDYTINDAWTIAETWDFTSNFTITDTTKITNLNADMVDGLHTSVTSVNNTIIARDGNGRSQINNPVADKDIANKIYVDSLIAGRSYEFPAMVAIDTNIDISNPSTATYDGVTLLNGDRVLLINQTNPVQNGLMVWNGVGAALSRPTDSDSPSSNAIETSSNINISNPGTSSFGGITVNSGDIVFLRAQTDPAQNGPYIFNGPGAAMESYTIFADLIPGSGVFVKKGTEYGGAQFNVSSPQAKKAISIDVDQQVWTQTNAQNVYSADGQGLELVGTQFRLEVDGVTLEKTVDHLHIHPSYAGQTSITTLGTVATGTWQGNTVAANYGGTGQTTYAQGDLLYYNGTSTQLARLGLGGLFQILMSDGTRPTWLDLTVGLIDTSNFAAGSVIFSNGSFFDADNANFFWNDTTNRFGLGNNTPQTQLHMKGTAPTIRLEQTGGNAGFGEITASTAYGDLIYTANAGGAGGVATHTWKHSSSTIAQMSAQGYLNLGGSARAFTAGLDVAAPSTTIPTAIFTLRDNLASSFQIKEGSNNYISIDTNNGAEKIVFGNTTTDPYYHFKGDNSLIIGEDPTIGIGNITDRLHVDGTMFSDTIQSQRIGRQGGYHFDGSNDYFEVPKVSFGTGDFTLHFDLEHDDVPGAAEAVAGTVSGNNRWIFSAYPTAYLFQIVNNSGVTGNYSFSVTPKAGRQSITVTVDRDDLAKLFINGRYIASSDVSGNSATDIGSGNAAAFRIGATANSFDGKIYGIKFYSVAKTHTEVINISQGFNDRANLELHFSESSTETWGWRDISGNDRHAVNYGAARIESQISRSYVNHTEFAQWNRNDGGYYFGNGAFITLPASSVNHGTNDFSWITRLKYKATGNTAANIWDTQGTTKVTGHFNSSNQLVITFDGTAETIPFVFIDGERYAIAFTADRDGNGIVYVNSIKVHSYSVSAKSASNIGNGVTAFLIGSSTTTADVEGMTVYQFTSFSKVLSSGSVADYSRGQRIDNSDSASVIANYTPESATDSIWEDVSGNQRNAINNAATITRASTHEPFVLDQDLSSISSKRKQGYFFNGIDGRGDFADGSAFNSNSITIIADVEPDQTKTSGTGIVVAGVGSGAFTNRRYLVYDYSTKTFFVQYGSSTSKLAESAKHTKHCSVAAVVNPDTGTAKMFVNGKLEATQTFTGISYDVATVAITSGDIAQASAGAFFKGEIKGVRILNFAASDEDAKSLMNGARTHSYMAGATGSYFYQSDFTVDTNSWGVGSGDGVMTVADTVGADSDNLKWTISSGAALKSIARVVGANIGKQIRFSFEYYLPSANSHFDSFIFYYGGGIQKLFNSSLEGTTYDAWTKVSGIAVITTEQTTISFYALDGGNVTVDDAGGDDWIAFRGFKLDIAGEVLNLNGWGAAPGKWHDQSGNGRVATMANTVLLSEQEYLYAKWIIDKNGSVGGDGQVLSKTSTGVEWINVTAAGGAGDIDGAGNGVANWMVIWDDTNTINRSTLLYDNATTIGIGYSGTAPTLPAAAKLAVNGVVHATSYLWATTTTHGLKFGTGYTELTNASGGVRLSSLNFRPNQANTNLGDTTNPWGSAVFSGRLASYQNLGTEKTIMTSIDSGQLGRSNASSESGAVFDLKMQTVSVGSGVGASVKLQPYRDEDNNNTLTAGAAWEYFPSDNAWGISSGSLKIGSVIINSTTHRPGRLVEHNFTVTGHGAGSPSLVTTVITHNLNNDTVIVAMNKRSSSGSEVTGAFTVAPWEPNSADPNNKIDVTVGSQVADTYYKIIICG